VSRIAKADDYINLASEDQRPFGWMQVMYVAEASTENADEVVLIARPVGLPFEAEDQVLPNPTVLRIVRRGLEVTAALMIEASPVASVFERMGVYVVQWRSLITGLLSDLSVNEFPTSIARTESHFA
jgi:hypothetical protein